MATSLDYFLPNVVTPDTRKRTQCHEQLVLYLSDSTTSLQCEDLDRLVDGLAHWISSSNYKISLNGLEVISFLIQRLQEGFRVHITKVLQVTVDRLGDSKDQVREAAQDVLLKLMVPASSPQYVFERVMGAFTHKLWRVKEEMLVVLQKTLAQYGSRSLTVSKLVPPVCKLLEDQSIPVREAAVATLVEIYRHVGERLRQDLMKRDINPTKLNTILSRLDEVRDSGAMLVNTDGHDEPDSSKASTTRRPSATSTTTSTMKKPAIAAKPTSSSTRGAAAGGVDVDAFTRGFEDVPKCHIFSSREVVDIMTRIRETLSDPNHPWEKRCDSLKELRSLLLAGAADYEEFYQCLRTLQTCLQTSVKDLRSQVVREACITVAYYSQQLGNKFDHFAELLLPLLINLIPNSAKIMASSGTVCIRLLLQNTHAPRLIPILTSNLSSKNSIIRRQCCEFLDHVLHTWPTHALERHIAGLQDAIKKGISDADAEARAHSRKAFWGFADHFKEQADSLLNSLDPARQKMLQGEISNSSSNNSLNNQGPGRVQNKTTKSRARSISTERSTSTLYSRPGSSSTQARRTAVQKSSTTDTTDGSTTRIMRSSSAVDLAGGSTTMPKTSSKTGAGRVPQTSNYNSLPRPKKSSVSSTSGSSNGSTAKSVLSPERSRPRGRMGVSQSQPGSRSGSPSSRSAYLTYTTQQQQQQPQPQQPTTTTTQRATRKSAIPRSQGASRETSPSRTYGRERKYSGQGLRGLGVSRQKTASGQSVLTSKVLTPGQDMEAAFADALRRKRYETYESDDAASETSSVCSERSYSSYSRTSEDMAEIVHNLGSGSWADRKEGLIALQNLLRGSRVLNRLELKKITEIFTRMFHDPHGKVFSIFLETLMDLLAVHRSDLHDWLYICLTRLLNKTGSDMLGSVHSKVQRALDAVRESFAYDQQFNTLTRFIVDQTQTPNLKVKVSLLTYMHGLAMLMDPADFTNSSDTRLAVSRIITWTTEPKSVDVRKAAQAVLIALFNLNPPEFSLMLSVLPKTFQDGATKILHNHLRSSGQETEPLSPRNVTSPTTGPMHRYRPSPNRTNVDDIGTENMNPEDIYNSIKQTSADIQNLSKLDSQFEEMKKDSSSQDDLCGSSPDSRDRPQYNPSYYQDDNLNGYNNSALAEAIFDVENELFNEAFSVDNSDVIAEILTELSNHNRREEERKNAMLQLIKMTREGSTEVWQEHFKTILLLLLETLGDNSGHIRALSLRVLREILKFQPDRFKDYAELTILKILEAHKDPIREVSRAAEECATTVASCMAAEQCVRVLVPIVQTAEFPVNLAAIKMETKVIESFDKEMLLKIMPDVMPGLLKGYDNKESSVRKASVFSLVAMHVTLGEELQPFLAELTGSKVKLLNLYIKRSAAQKDSSASTSKTTSPTLTDLV